MSREREREGKERAKKGRGEDGWREGIEGVLG